MIMIHTEKVFEIQFGRVMKIMMMMTIQTIFGKEKNILYLEII